MHDRISLHGLGISNVTMRQTIEALLTAEKTREPLMVFTPNAEIVMQATRDPDLAVLLNQAALLLPDGAGVVLGARMLGTPLKEKVSGIDVARRLFEQPSTPPLRFFLFGGKPGVAEKAAANLLARYPGIEIAGCRDGYFQQDESTSIVNAINASRADFVFVCLGAPKQERWIAANREALRCRAALGLGGSLDVFAGTGKLAPEWMRRAGLEWLYRLSREPHRWRRMLDLPRFILLTLMTRLRKG